MVLQSLAGLPAFLLYFCISTIAVVCFLWVYTRITAHDEFDLLAKNVPGAAVSLGLSMLGFALPVASAVAHASDVVDCIIWSVIALCVQVIAYYVVRIPVPTYRSASPTARWLRPSGWDWRRSPQAC
jgi:putative membrane protein